MIVESLEAAEDVMGEVSIENITECIGESAWKSWRRTGDGQKEPSQTKERVQSQKNHPNIAEGEE